MQKIGLDFDFNEIKELQDAIDKLGIANASVLPSTSQAFGQSALYVKKVWSNYLAGGSLDGLRALTDQEQLSVRGTKLKAEQTGDFTAKVSSEGYKLDKLQEGTPDVDYDMKKTHPYGRKSRVNAKGIPYLIIPFRWGTPNAKGTKRRWNNVIPQKEYETILKGFELSTVKERNPNNPRYEKNAKGELIERANYSWKSRLSDSDAWDDRSAGMVRMKDVRGSTYFTFRIISAKSPQGSWLYHRDGTQGIDMLGALARTVKPGVEKIIESGLKADLSL